jgi:hypothetical protein
MGLWPRNSFSGNICFEFRLLCLCSASLFWNSSSTLPSGGPAHEIKTGLLINKPINICAERWRDGKSQQAPAGRAYPGDCSRGGGPTGPRHHQCRRRPRPSPPPTAPPPHLTGTRDQAGKGVANSL